MATTQFIYWPADRERALSLEYGPSTQYTLSDNAEVFLNDLFGQHIVLRKDVEMIRYLGIGEEDNFGQAATISKMLDPESVDLDPASDQAIIYPGMSGVDRFAKPGPYTSSGSVNHLIDLEMFGYWLKWALGAVESASNTHVFTAKRDPQMQSFTARIGKDVFEHVFKGCVVNSLTIEVTDSLAQFTADILGGEDASSALQNNPSFDEGAIFAPHEVTLELSGTDQSARVESFSLSIENNVDIEGGVTLGKRFPRRAYRGGLQITGELQLAFLDTEELQRFWGGSTGPTEGQSLTDFGVTIHLGNNFDIELPRCIYTAMSQPAAGRDRIEQSGTLHALQDVSANNEIIQVTIQNSVQGYN